MEKIEELEVKNKKKTTEEKTGPLENVMKKENILFEVEEEKSGDMGHGGADLVISDVPWVNHHCYSTFWKGVGSSSQEAVDVVYLVCVFTATLIILKADV